METTPPTQDTLLQHCRRVAYHAGIWNTSNKYLAQQELPSPEGHGWKLSKECKWSPVWITLPVASKAWTELDVRVQGAVEEMCMHTQEGTMEMH